MLDKLVAVRIIQWDEASDHWGIKYTYESGREASEFIGSRESAIHFAAKSRPRPRLRLVGTAAAEVEGREERRPAAAVLAPAK